MWSMLTQRFIPMMKSLSSTAGDMWTKRKSLGTFLNMPTSEARPACWITWTRKEPTAPTSWRTGKRWPVMTRRWSNFGKRRERGTCHETQQKCADGKAGIAVGDRCDALVGGGDFRMQRRDWRIRIQNDVLFRWGKQGRQIGRAH